VSRPLRIAVFLVGGALLVGSLVVGLHALPRFGHYHGIYETLVQRIEPKTREATDLVTSLNFDLRAFDTLGEEFILFASVAGVSLLLRHLRGEEEPEERPTPEEHPLAPASPALRLLAVALVAPITALGLYVIIHGTLTPGGGFQGGIVLACAPAVVMLAGRYITLRRDAPEWALEAFESTGAVGYALIGIGGLVFAGVYMKNFLPAGTSGRLFSAGDMAIISFAIGIEVTGAFLLVWSEFLDQTITSGGGGQR
jgi:multicomponent Na+:H+ antiporter subunit B